MIYSFFFEKLSKYFGSADQKIKIFCQLTNKTLDFTIQEIKIRASANLNLLPELCTRE
jgi:hypothetical protein